MQTAHNSTQLGGYIVGITIGRGTFGKVKKAIHKLTGEPVAIKYLQKIKIKDITDVQRVSRQLHFLKLVRHPAIAQLYQIIETSKMIFIVMEFATGGEYFDYITDEKIKNQEQSYHYFSQIVSALIYLHKLKISHRDVKPQNMLLDVHKRIKLVDFGLSNMYKQGQKLTTACGSPCYASPEMIKGQDYDPQLTDIWSLGIVLYASVMAQLPFQHQNTNSLYAKIKSGFYVIDKKISPQLKDLLSKLINVKPQNRIRLQQILHHPWYKKFQAKKQISGIQIGYQNIPIDKNIVQQMQSLGFQTRKTIKFLQNNMKNSCTTTYYLFMKRNFRSGKPSSMDICSDNFQRKSITSIFNLKPKRYKSFDMGRILESQQSGLQLKLKKDNRNCFSQHKHRYQSTKEVQKVIQAERKSSKKSLNLNSKKSIYSFIKTRAQIQVRNKINKNDQIRKKSVTVSTQKPNQSEKYKTQAVRSSNGKIKINIQNNEERLKCRIKTDFTTQIYCPKRINKKQQNEVSRQKVKNPFQIDVSNVFWRKKSTNLKQNTGNSTQYSRGIRHNIHINF